MADKTPEQEPSIEEILASIRQIISDDDDKDSGNEAAAAPVPEPEKPAVKAEEPAPAPKPEPKPTPTPVKEDDVLELTEAEAIVPEMPPAPAPKPDPIDIIMQDHGEEEDEPSIDDIFAEEEPAMPQASADDSILSNTTRQAAISSMAKLAGNMPINRPAHNTAGSVTLEDIVREILNPMLREWMDKNLPPMVERIVQKELEKLARQVLDE